MDNAIRKKALILDFDGTMCYTFSNFSLSRTVEQLKEQMKAFGVEFTSDKDAFDVFFEIRVQTESRIWEDAFVCADKTLTMAELEAVENCELVPGIKECLPELIKNGYLIGVATNNSEQCVNKLLDKYWPAYTIPVVGRVPEKPELMKPSGWTLEQCIKLLHAEAENVLFVGDTKNDYLCAKAIGCKFVGMGSTERKKSRLMTFCPEEDIVTDYYELIKYLKNYHFSV